MNQETVWTVLVTLVTVLGGGGAWRFYERRALRRERDEEFIRNDCKDRITKLEALLEHSAKEKDQMRDTILRLTEQVAQLAVKIEFLQRENLELQKVIEKREAWEAKEYRDHRDQWETKEYKDYLDTK